VPASGRRPWGAGRMGEISDIVDAVLFLDNAPFVTGEILYVDGGVSVGH
jgi:NAD(P)-dependent dehydrogenase (short-subunit alcohol dehydrogenase family)